MSETRYLCTECWTEGEGTAPKACPVCGTVGAWFVTATHGDRPLKEVLTGLFTGYQVPSELEDVLEKPSERAARLEDEKQAADLREAVDTLLDEDVMDDIEKVALVEAAYAQNKGTPLRDTITATDIARALGRDDEERAALAEAFKAADRDKDLWLECANIWIAHCRKRKPHRREDDG